MAVTVLTPNIFNRTVTVLTVNGNAIVLSGLRVIDAGTYTCNGNNGQTYTFTDYGDGEGELS